MNMRKLLMVRMAALFLLIDAGTVFAEEYKLFYSGTWQGVITATRDSQGKITITPRVTNEINEKNGWVAIDLIHSQCPLVPEGKEFPVFSFTKEIVIDGNTTTITRTSGEWEKRVVDGNTTTTTFSWGDFWEKEVVDGNTHTHTDSSGTWAKSVVDGNTTTAIDSEGIIRGWHKTVVDGNTTTITSSGGWEKTVVDGNTTIKTWSESREVRPRMIVVDRQGYNIHIFTTTVYDSILNGHAHYAQKNYALAIADYTHAIRLDPNDASWYYSRGHAHYAQKNYALAIADYTHAIRLDPNNASWYYSRGNAHYLQKNYDQAIADYEAALRVDPNHANAREWLGNARQARGY
ncbi:hypothetical protein FACS189491_04650 [Spirochaetia bacterium]|nr:hypothetical protein FACS189491_04650 [Spirochaetia bacterium]